MTVFFRLSAVAAVLASFAVAAGSASADTTALPFVVHASYDATPTPDAACGGLRVVASGAAIGNEIGAAQWNDTECASLVAQPGSIVITGTLTLTAANGDELFIDYTATTPLPDATGAIHPAGTFTIVGGTGRFAGATGGGTLTADANVTSPATTATLVGTIDR